MQAPKETKRELSFTQLLTHQEAVDTIFTHTHTPPRAQVLIMVLSGCSDCGFCLLLNAY